MQEHPFARLIQSGFVRVTLKVTDPQLALESLSEEFLKAASKPDSFSVRGFHFFNVQIGHEERGQAFTDELMQLIRKYGY